MHIVSITEFGAAPNQYQEVLRDLAAANVLTFSSHNTRGQDYYVASLGSADLVQIRLTNQYPLLISAATSSGHSFRRSTGAYCAGLGHSHTQITDAESILNSNESPLMALTYARLSPMTLLCGCESKPRVYRVFERLISKETPIWERYQRFVGRQGRCVEADGQVPSMAGLSRDPRMAVLIGLDSIDFVFITKAFNLDQLAALAFTLRSLHLGEILPYSENTVSLERARNLFPKFGDFSETWDGSALFEATTTVVGSQLRKIGDSWQLDSSHFHGEAASEAIISLRSVIETGRLDEALTNQPTVPKIIPSRNESPDPRRLILLFDRSDLLQLPPELEETALGRLTLDEVTGHLSRLTGISKPTPEGLSTSTEIGVSLRLTTTSAPSTSDLNALLRNLLRKRRRQHLENGWLPQWRQAALKAGMVTSAALGGESLISSILEYLEDDLEAFADLLPGIQMLVQQAQELASSTGSGRPYQKAVNPRGLRTLAGVLQGMASYRGRRDQPLRYPRGTLAFEGFAGHRISRDAFTAFVEWLGRVLDPKALMAVLESSGGGMSCRPQSNGVNVVHVSPFVLYHPIHWVFAHESAHGRFQSCLLESLGDEFGRLRAPWGPLAPDTTVHRRFQSFTQSFLAWSREPPLLFAKGLARIAEEVAADLLLRRSLGNAGDEAFWFVYGPALIVDSQHTFGASGPDLDFIIGLILRIFFVKRLLSGNGAPREGWKAALERWLDHNAEFAPKTTDDGREVGAGAPDGYDYTVFLMEDMAVRWSFREACELIRPGFESCTDRVLDEVADWLEFSQKLTDRLEPVELQPNDSIALQCFVQYINRIMDLFPNARPWIRTENRGDLGCPKPKRPTRVHLNPVGGIEVSDPHSRERYVRETLDFIFRMDDLARDFRLQKLERYLGET